MSRMLGRRIAILAVSMLLAFVPGGLASGQDCPGDVDGDNTVDVSDLLAVLAAWGPCDAPCPPCAEDFNGDCTVDVSDLLALLAAWGPCPEPCDPNGTWVIASGAWQYSCFIGIFQIQVTTLTFVQNETTLSITGDPLFNSISEVTLIGSPTECGFGETFIATAVIPGSCQESYELEGSFITEDQFVATLTVGFSGESCADCINQEFNAVFNRAP